MQTEQFVMTRHKLDIYIYEINSVVINGEKKKKTWDRIILDLYTFAFAI